MSGTELLAIETTYKEMLIYWTIATMLDEY